MRMVVYRDIKLDSWLRDTHRLKELITMKYFHQWFEIRRFDHWEVHQMDMKTAFLQGNLEEEIYMRQPDGYVSEEYPDHVCKLKESIYGLKQSARCWNNAIDTFLKSNGYKQMESDPCLYMKSIKDQKGIITFVILSIHVDDILLFSNGLSMLNDEKKSIASKFKIEDMGEVKHILGMLIKRDRARGKMTISQS